MSAETVFDIKKLSFSWSKAKFLQTENIHIPSGDCVSLIGPNGSGKTTFLKLLNNLLSADPGSDVYFAGEKLTASPSLRKRSVYVHQHPYLVSGNVSSNVGLSCKAQGLPRKQAERKIREALEALGLSGYGNRNRNELSGGETQRVAFARALASGADVFLLDEPTSSTDAESTRTITSIIRSLKENGATILLSTHDMDFAREISSRTLLFDSGHIKELRQ